jgi:hypothetical protein
MISKRRKERNDNANNEMVSYSRFRPSALGSPGL